MGESTGREAAPMGESTGREAALRLPPAVGELGRRRQPCSSQPSSTASAASSSSGRREADAEEGEQGLGKKHGRRKSSRRRREAVVREIRDRLPAAPSCWGGASVVRGSGGRSQRERPRDVGRGGGAVDVEENSGLATATGAPAWWCCVCPDGDCSLEANPSANGKEDAGVRSLIESNDFYSDDCNPHAAAVACPGARFD